MANKRRKEVKKTVERSRKTEVFSLVCVEI